MTIGIVGRKAGMTRVFMDDGAAIPVTVIECTPNRVTLVKTVESDGYTAVQVAIGDKKPSRVNKALTGHYKKAGVAAGRALYEFRLADGEGKDLKPGSELKVESFDGVKAVDVTGITIGKGFAGVIKRHHFGGGRATHGNSLSHRVAGSIGQRQSPGKVWKGKPMAGHLGNVRKTTLNLDLVKIDVERGLLLVKGAVPGAKGGDLIVKPTTR
jgi:large subunit ribosomal protein L3